MKGQTNKAILGPKLQRNLRNRPTDAERLLWRHLSGRQLNGCKFRRQHPFNDYILDFVCLEHRLIIELDGGQHADQAADDTRRDAELESSGFRVLRFWNNQAIQETEAVLETILSALLAPSPLPPLQGEGRGGDGSHLPPTSPTSPTRP